jgi:hypothetical protein
MKVNKVNKSANKQKVFVKTKTNLNTNMVINHVDIRGNGRQTRKRIPGIPDNKYVDIAQSGSISASGSILGGITNISQGISVSQRIGDSILCEKLFMNYTINAQNSDIFSNCRIIVFQWHPNDTLAAPLVTSVLQSANIYSMYNWQLSNQYVICYDTIHFMSGLATAPSDSGNQGYFGTVNLSKIQKRVEFTAASTAGSNELFILAISDSVLAPFPLLNILTRLIYSED